jgi:hypothetical protein
MRRGLAFALVVAVVAVLWLRHRARPATSPSAAPAGRVADRTSSSSRAASAASAPAQPAAAPGAAAVRRIAPDERADMLRRLEAARHGAPSPSPSSASPAPPEQPLDREYIAEQVRALLPLLGECYTNALQRDPKLAGKMVVNFSIVGDPSVGGLVGDSKIDAENSTIADAEMRQCVQETMYAARFVPPKDSGEVQVTYPFVFLPSNPEE